MIFKAIKGSIKNTYIRKLRLHCTKYEWRYDGGIIRNDGTTMIYLIFKRINPATRIVFSNLKYEIDKATLAKFLSNKKDLLDYMSSNYSMIIDKRELHEDYVRHIFRAILSGPK